MIKSKTKIETQLKKKNNVLLVETIIESKKNPNWILVAQLLVAPGRNLKSINLSDIESTEGNIIVGKSKRKAVKGWL